MERYIYGYDPAQDVEVRQSSVSTFSSLVSKVYLWMTMALAMTGLTAFYVANSGLVFALANSASLFWGLMIAELAVVWILSANIMRLSFPVAGIMFAVYSILNGATCSFIFIAYTAESLTTTFFVTAGTFGAMSLIGAFIKKDLSGMGRMLIMALIGLIIATIVNFFVASSTLSWAITYIGVLIFCGLTAYDTQKMKEMLYQYQHMGDTNILKIALLCSLSLYLDFINLFLYLLRIFGGKRD